MRSFEEEHSFALAYRLVEEGKLDPWDVDISALARAYMEEIRRLELLDLRAPARVVLAASFLLKKQAELLFPEPRQRRERKRLSLQEIVQQFESQQEQLQEETTQKVYKIRRVLKKPTSQTQERRRKEQKLPLHVSKFEDALVELRELFLSSGKSLSFYQIVLGKSFVPYLMALMVLYQEGLVDIEQEKPFGDLIIKTSNGSYAGAEV
ncbi:MAG: segregation/condensation protein A [Aquificaceae bacterium]|nr:segregation/condensation protein A [Aquificaceae bacterium]MCX8059777.1 segregation/condensation protein A [Aquificaceae bacterium]MDW8097547.1 segregation/condensation protein A [Aquificaceae bacterium]